MKSFPLKTNRKVWDFLKDFCREMFMYSSLRFISVLLLCLTCLSYCAPKASAQEGYGKTWSNKETNAEDLAITVVAIEEWSNFEWKVFRVDLKNLSDQDLQFGSPLLQIEGLSEQPSQPSGQDVNRMISGYKAFRPRGSWPAEDSSYSKTHWPYAGGIGGNRTANVIFGLTALLNTAGYISESKKNFAAKDDIETISPIKDSDWNSTKPLVLMAGEMKRRWFALRLSSFQEVDALRIELLDSEGKPRSFRTTRSFAESK